MAQDESIRFEHLSLDQGLSQTTINDITQCHQGFIWIATEDGLNRYDGYEFKVYKHDPQDRMTISDSLVNTLLPDDSGDLWVGTRNNGLNLYSARMDAFRSIDLGVQSQDVRGLALDSKGHLWVGTYGSGLIVYDTKSGEIINLVKTEHQASLSTNLIGELLIDTTGFLWVATYGGGLCRVNIENHEVTRLSHDPNNPNSLAKGDVLALMEDLEGHVWVGCREGGLNIWQPSSQTFQHAVHEPERATSLSGNDINDLFQDRDGRIWICTRTGLNSTVSTALDFKRYEHNPTDEFSLPHDITTRLFEDRTGALWIGTLGAGIAKWNRATKGFRHYRYLAGHQQSLSSNSIWSIKEDLTGDLWVGTSRGVNRITKKLGLVTTFRHDPEDDRSLSSDIVRAIYITSDGRVWAGTDGSGVCLLSQDQTSFTVYRSDPTRSDTLPHDTIRCFLESQDGQFWIGTYGGGLSLHDRSSGNFTNYQHDPVDNKSISDDRVYTMIETSEGAFWIGTHGGGLNLFDRATGRFRRYRHDPDIPDSLSSDGILGLSEDSSKRIWVCTANGLSLFEPEKHRFRVYRERDGLPNNVVYGILEDLDGHMWMSTNNGLAELDVESGNINSYQKQDGLQSNEFNGGAYFSGRDGTLYFGGIAGFNSFNPRDISVNRYPPAVVITDFLLFNRSVRPNPNSDENVLQNAIAFTDSIVLNHRQSAFGLEFAALHYADSDQNQYAYRMEGLDEHWIHTNSQRRFASYNRLPPGLYHFKVKASNSDGFWNHHAAGVSIRVLPPPWRTWWAYGIYLLIFLALAVGIPTWRFHSLKQRQVLLSHLVDERTSDLKERNNQLETLEQTIHAINRENGMDHLMSTLLKQSLALIPRATAGRILLRNNDAFEVFVTQGYLSHEIVDLSIDEDAAVNRYLLDPQDKGTGVFLDVVNETNLNTEPAPSLILAIRSDTDLYGLLVMDHPQNAPPFTRSDIDRLTLLRGHVVTAVEKSYRIQELNETALKLEQTQAELVDAAHRAGMAEIAENVLHNIGNSLNSLAVSLGVANDLAHGSGPYLMGRVAEMFKENENRLAAFLTNDPKGTQLSKALPSLASELDQRIRKLHNELDASGRHVTTMTEIIKSQRDYAGVANYVCPVAINELLDQVLLMNQERIDQLDISVVRDYDGLPSIRLSKSKFTQVVTSLIVNACDALSDVTNHSRQLNLRTRQDPKGYVQIQVEDNGPGVPQELRKRVFSPGFSKKTQHTGMGLHNCAIYVADMRGLITVDQPKEKEGAVFTVLLPNTPL